MVRLLAITRGVTVFGVVTNDVKVRLGTYMYRLMTNDVGGCACKVVIHEFTGKQYPVT